MKALMEFIQKPWRINRLQNKYYNLSFQSRNEARKSLNRQLMLLKNKYPGYSQEWYLEKIIYDLKRDRR